MYTRAVTITPSNSVNLDDDTNAIFVGGAGVVAVMMPGGETVNFTCVAGQVLPISARRINSTNTTATLLVALYSY